MQPWASGAEALAAELSLGLHGHEVAPVHVKDVVEDVVVVVIVLVVFHRYHLDAARKGLQVLQVSVKRRTRRKSAQERVSWRVKRTVRCGPTPSFCAARQQRQAWQQEERHQTATHTIAVQACTTEVNARTLLYMLFLMVSGVTSS